jgi:nitrous oxide reductase
MKLGALIIVIIVIAAVGFGIYYFMNRPEVETAPVSEVNQVENTVIVPAEREAVEVPVSTAKEFSFTVENGDVTEKPEKFEVTQDDEVTVTVMADSDDEIHLHGYNLSSEVAAGEASVLTFTANKAGRFEIELEDAKITLGFLEVQPK